MLFDQPGIPHLQIPFPPLAVSVSSAVFVVAVAFAFSVAVSVVVAAEVLVCAVVVVVEYALEYDASQIPNIASQ